jgi:hypothetical protein
LQLKDSNFSKTLFYFDIKKLILYLLVDLENFHFNENFQGQLMIVLQFKSKIEITIERNIVD